MLAVLAPGQGSQKPGFLAPWLDLPGDRGRACAGGPRWPASTWSTSAPAPTRTRSATPPGPSRCWSRPPWSPAEHLAARRRSACVAGHSVGEIGAAALAGVLTPEAAVTFAAVRGREMAAACALEPTGMSAVLGGDPDEVRRRHRRRRAATRPTATAPARSSPPGRSPGWRSSPPRHRPRPGSSRCRSPARSTPRTWPRPRRRSPRVAGGITAGHARAGSCCPMRTAPASATARRCWPGWSPRSPPRCAGTCACARWPTSASPRVIELPPAGTLAGLVKRELKGTEIVTVNTPDDLTAARDLISRHGWRPATSRRWRSCSRWRPSAAPSSRCPTSPRAPRSRPARCSATSSPARATPR